MTDLPRADPQFHMPPRRVIGLALLAAAIFWFARPVIAPFIVAAFIAYAFTPAIDALQVRTGRSRKLIVVAVVATGVALLVALVLAFANPVYREGELLIRSGPDALKTALRQLLQADSITIGDRTFTVPELAAQLEAAVRGFLQTPEGAIQIASRILTSTVDIVLTIIVTFYLLLDGGRLTGTALRFLHPSDRAQMGRLTKRIHVVLGRWLRGQLILIVFVSIVVSIVLGPILGVPHALPLGIMTGVLEVIPFVGPIIAGLIVAIVALSSGGITLAIVVVVFLFVLRQVEDAVMMPLILGRSVNLHPLIALFAIVVGTTAFGVLGTFFAVPVAAAINVGLHEFFPAELGPLPGDPPDPTALPADEGPTPDEPTSAPTA